MDEEEKAFVLDSLCSSLLGLNVGRFKEATTYSQDNHRQGKKDNQFHLLKVYAYFYSQRFAIWILSLTCSASGCERNWSVFERVHTKKRNRLLQKKMNDIVYVMYNSKLLRRQAKTIERIFDEIDSNDEWVAGDDVEGVENVKT
ncbi:hypothetical protein LINGRAHAP2_LOCUS20295 [Linum grandiflorum]